MKKSKKTSKNPIFRPLPCSKGGCHPLELFAGVRRPRDQNLTLSGRGLEGPKLDPKNRGFFDLDLIKNYFLYKKFIVV